MADLIDFLPGQQYTLGYSRLIYLRRVKAKVPMWLFQYPSGPLETFTEWQLEDALHPPKRRGPKIRPPKKVDGN